MFKTIKIKYIFTLLGIFLLMNFEVFSENHDRWTTYLSKESNPIEQIGMRILDNVNQMSLSDDESSQYYFMGRADAYVECVHIIEYYTCPGYQILMDD